MSCTPHARLAAVHEALRRHDAIPLGPPADGLTAAQAGVWLRIEMDRLELLSRLELESVGGR